MQVHREFWADRPVPWRKAFWGAFLLGLGFLLQSFAARNPAFVEAVYSRGIYPWIGGVLSWTASCIPFSLAEICLVVLTVLGIWHLTTAIRSRWRGDRSWGNSCAHFLAHATRAGGIAYLVFLSVWGFHYARVALGTNLEFPEGAVQSAELRALREELERTLPELRSQVPEDAQGVAVWSHGPERLVEEARRAVAHWAAGLAWPTTRHTAPKFSFFSPVLSRLGITGIYCPFTGESHGNAELLDLEKAFVLCHEIAHAYGFAREDEANFVAAMACRGHENSFFRYAGAFHSLRYLGAELRGDGSGFDRDWRALRAFWARVRGQSLGPISIRWMMDASHAINDTYLKTQGQSAGVRSYGLMVELLVRERRR